MKKLSAYKVYGVVYCMLLILFPPFCFSQTVPAPVSVSVSCSGTVYDNASKKPLTGAKVTITNTSSNKKIANTTSGSDGSYFFRMPEMSNIEVLVTMDGYKKEEKNFTEVYIKEYKGRLPDIYLDTAVTFKITPAVPVRQSKEKFITDKLASLDIVPLPAAYELLAYLNPGLMGRDSLMSNDKIILPKMPRIKNDVKRENKKQFQSDKDHDKSTQNRLRDTLDKVIGIVGEDISAYKIKYDRTTPETLKRMREYIRMDLQGYKEKISKTSKLKAEGIITLLSKMGIAQQKIITQRSIQATDFDHMKMLWEDLSYLLISNRYKLIMGRFKKESEKAVGFITASYLYQAAASDNNTVEMMLPVATNNDRPAPEPAIVEDEVGVFGFVVWGPAITSNTEPNLAQPGNRYVIRYFKPAFEDEKDSYESCKGPANVAITNLTRARYGVEIYDTKEKKYVETLHPTFTTEEAFSRKYDALVVPDFKEVKFIIITLK